MFRPVLRLQSQPCVISLKRQLRFHKKPTSSLQNGIAILRSVHCFRWGDKLPAAAALLQTALGTSPLRPVRRKPQGRHQRSGIHPRSRFRAGILAGSGKPRLPGRSARFKPSPGRVPLFDSGTPHWHSFSMTEDAVPRRPMTAEDVVRRIAVECAFVDQRGGVGIRLRPAAAIVRQYGEQFRRAPPRRRRQTPKSPGLL